MSWTSRSAARPPRVCFLAGTLATGGAEKQLVYMARALDACGVDVHVLTLGDEQEAHEETLSALGIPVTAVPRAGGRAGRLVAVTRAAARLAPDVVQAAHTYVSLYAAVAARACGAASLGALRSSLAHTRGANGALARFHLRAPDGIVVNSESAAADLRSVKGFRPRRLFVVPNAVELPPPRPRRCGPPVAAFVGRLVPEKRPELFLEALALARRRAPSLAGILVGDGPERARVAARASELGLLPDGVRLLGLRPDVPALLESADMLLLTSTEEGFPNVLLEAMAASLPIVTTPAGDAAAVVRDGESGFVENGAETLAERLVQLALSPDLRARLGDAGRLRAGSEYGLEKLAGNLFEVYRQLAGAKPRVRALA